MPLTEDLEEKWRGVKAQLRARLGERVYSAWFPPLHLEDIVEDICYCSAPSHFLKRWIEDHYLSDLRECITLKFPEVREVSILERGVGKPAVIPDSYTNDTGSPPKPITEDTEEQKREEARSKLPKPLPDGKIQMNSVIEHTCFKYEMPRKQFMTTRQFTEVLPRQIGMFLSFYMAKRKLPEIARLFGGRDHTTVLQSVRKIRRLVVEDIAFAFEVAGLESAIRNRQLLE